MKEKIETLRVILPTIVFSMLFLSVAPGSWGESLEERIKTLEEVQRANAEELARLKGEQMELKKQATEAAAALPTFTHRPRSGLYVEAADKSWGLRFRSRFHYRLLTWPDDKAEDSAGFSQFDLALRRVRSRVNYFWDNRFYEFDFEINVGADRSFSLQHGEMHIHFEKLNPYLPELTFGPRVSSYFNRHDTNWGSSTGGVFDRSMFQDGAGIGAGTQNNGIGLFWDEVPIGSGEMLFQAVYSNQGLVGLNDASRPKSDKRAVHIGWNYEPFSKTKSKWLRGIDFGVGYQLDRVHPDSEDSESDVDGRDFFQVRTTERQRLRFIRVNNSVKVGSKRQYITPGFGWRVGPYWLRTALAWNLGEMTDGSDIKGFMWKIHHELFVWSPKGFLTGSNSTPGSIMFFTGFERLDYEAENDNLNNCSSVTGGDCTRAGGYVSNVGLWYFIQRGLRVGVEYGRYVANKINSSGAGSLKNVSAGDRVTFHTLEFGFTYDF